MRLRAIRIAWPEAVILIAAFANFVHMWWTAHTFPGGCLMCPWFFPWQWTSFPSRILLAAVLLLVARVGFRLAAVVLAAQPLVMVSYFYLAPDELRLCFQDGLDYLIPLQGAIGAAIVGVGSLRAALGARGQLMRRLRIPLAALLVFASLGYVSAALGTRTCEETVADWVAREGLAGRPFTVIPGIGRWSRSVDIFRRVGARVYPFDALAQGLPDFEPAAAVSAALHPAPFLVRVEYEYRYSKYGKQDPIRGNCVFFAGPGFVIRLKALEPWLPRIDTWVWAATQFP